MNLDEFKAEAERKSEEARRAAAAFDDRQRAKLGTFWKVFLVFAGLVSLGALVQCVAS